MITGYRKLSSEELAMINDIKLNLGAAMLSMMNATRLHVSRQRAATARLTAEASRADTVAEAKLLRENASVELKRLDEAQPERWIAVANTHFQQGLMALERAVAQPEGL